jgi:hypothetical protein
LFLPYSWDKNGHENFFETEQGAAATAHLLQQEPHVEVVDLKSSVASSDEERLAAGISTIRLQTKRLSGAQQKRLITERKMREGIWTEKKPPRKLPHLRIRVWWGVVEV